MAHVEKSVSMQRHFEQNVGKQRRLSLEGKYLDISEAEPLRFDCVHQILLEKLCRTLYWLKYFSKPYRPPDSLKKTLFILCQMKSVYLPANHYNVDVAVWRLFKSKVYISSKRTDIVNVEQESLYIVHYNWNKWLESTSCYCFTNVDICRLLTMCDTQENSSYCTAFCSRIKHVCIKATTTFTFWHWQANQKRNLWLVVRDAQQNYRL